MFDPKTFTYGYEVEWGDVDRRLKIPEHLGEWDYSETDIVNLYEPFANIACDPLGETPHMGGEINTKPTVGWEAQADRTLELWEFFANNGSKPTAGCVNEGHIHVHIPGLREDYAALKRLTLYIQQNQDLVIEKCVGFVEHPTMKGSKGAKTYLKYDIGRKMPDYMVENICKHASDFESFIRMQCAGKDPLSRGRPFRYAINTYCLKHTNTVEFRCFRSTTQFKRIKDQLRFVAEFMNAALNTGESVAGILARYNYEFPEFYWDKTQYDGWIATKYPKERGNKVRKYYDIK